MNRKKRVDHIKRQAVNAFLGSLSGYDSPLPLGGDTQHKKSVNIQVEGRIRLIT